MKPAPVSCEIPQGTVFVPLLFLVYKIDLPQEVISTSRSFPDDYLLYRAIRSKADTIKDDLDRLMKWEKIG